jgi:hypothetical protein
MIILGFVIAVYLMIGASSDSSIIATYNSLKPDSTSGLSKTLVFLKSYTGLTGDTSLALSVGVSESDAQEMAAGTYGSVSKNANDTAGNSPHDSSNHNHYQVQQSNYASTSLGPSGNISNNGCGLCSMTFVIAELSGTIISPPDFKSQFPSTVRAGWGNSNGMGWDGPTTFVTELNSKGTYGTYEMVEYSSSTVGCSVVMRAIEKYAGDANTAILVSSSSGLFTDGGHIICITDLSDDGKSFHVADSSTKAKNHLSVSYDTVSTYDYPLYDSSGNLATSHKGYNYHFKGYWVIRKVG